MPFLGIFLLLMLNLNFFVCQCQYRDPFYLPQPNKNVYHSENIRILGIIESDNILSAILLIDGHEQAVFKGDVIEGFEVSSIKIDGVIISKNNQTKILSITK